MSRFLMFLVFGAIVAVTYSLPIQENDGEVITFMDEETGQTIDGRMMMPDQLAGALANLIPWKGEKDTELEERVLGALIPLIASAIGGLLKDTELEERLRLPFPAKLPQGMFDAAAKAAADAIKKNLPKQGQKDTELEERGKLYGKLFRTAGNLIGQTLGWNKEKDTEDVEERLRSPFGGIVNIGKQTVVDAVKKTLLKKEQKDTEN